MLTQMRKILVSELTSAKQLEASKYIRAEEIGYMLRTVCRETGPIRVRTYLNIMSTNIRSRMILSKLFLGAAVDQTNSETHEFIETCQWWLL